MDFKNDKNMIKKLEDIDWNDFDFEEEIPSPLEVGDIVIVNGTLRYWTRNKFHEINRYSKYEIVSIDKSENIIKDLQYKYKKGSIPYSGWLVMFKDHWPWFKYDENVMKKI